MASLGANRASGASTQILPGTTRTGSVGVELNWPLYTGGSVQNRIKETVSLEQRSREELENARRTVAQNTRVAFFGVQSGEALVKALEAAESSSRLSLEATQLGYKVGVRVNIDVLNAQTQLFQTQRDLFKSRYDVLVNSLRLRQASGAADAERPAGGEQPAGQVAARAAQASREPATASTSRAMRSAAPRCAAAKPKARCTQSLRDGSRASTTARATPSSMPATRIAAPAASDSSAASLKL